MRLIVLIRFRPTETTSFMTVVNSESLLLFFNTDLARIKLITQDFLNMKTNDVILQNIKLVLITALCSKSGVANPVNFVVSEGEGIL